MGCRHPRGKQPLGAAMAPGGISKERRVDACTAIRMRELSIGRALLLAAVVVSGLDFHVAGLAHAKHQAGGQEHRGARTRDGKPHGKLYYETSPHAASFYSRRIEAVPTVPVPLGDVGVMGCRYSRIGSSRWSW